MAKKGRKKKAGARTPSGQLSRSTIAILERGERDFVMNQPHRACLPESKRMDQRAESELGRLFLTGQITEAQCWAGERWREVVKQFRQFLASPVVSGSMLGNMVAHGAGAGEDEASGTSERPETDEERRSRVLAQHGRALRAIPRESFPMMEAVVIHDQPMPPYQIMALREGLGSLARLWKMSEDVPLRVRGSRAERPVWGHDEKEIRIVYADP